MRTVLLIISLGLLLPILVNGQEGNSNAPTEQEQATIYFYRKAEFYNGRFECWVDDVRLVSNYKAASYFWLNLPAGTYEIRTNGRPSWLIYEKKYQLKVEAGQVYYIEGVIEYDFLGTALFLQERNQADFDELQSKLKFDASAIRLLD
ncbi:MAG: DUF2846 domain-containing protein [Saprospiraceae bacterium]|nr:DUF2846 domain-containing protein [Saprospiraceae bacterium]